MATQDVAWKIVLEQFFPEFAEFFLEDLYKDIGSMTLCRVTKYLDFREVTCL